MKRLVTLCYVLLLAATAWAGDVGLAWDQSVSPDLAGNKVYIGRASGTYWTPITIPLQTVYKATGLAPGIYYFAVTAFDVNGEESGYSNEVSATVPEAPFSITAQSCSANWYGVVCLATVSAKSSAIFRYQQVGLNGWTLIIATPTPTKTQHRAIVYQGGGTPTYYNYEWQITDANNITINGTGTFRTK